MPEFPSLKQREQLRALLAADFQSLLPSHPLPELERQRLFITGATGFVGRWLLLAIHCLNAAGADIEVLALSRHPDPYLEHNPEWKSTPWLRWITGDIRDFPHPGAPIDAIIHAATDTSADFAKAHPDHLYDSMVRGTEHLIHFAEKLKRPRLLLLSSGAIYGEQATDLPRLTEEFGESANLNLDAYGQGKRVMERISNASGLDVVIARCFTFVGFGLAPHLAISQFIRDAQENPFIAVKGDGQTVRSYLYGADLAMWLLTLLARGRPGWAYNVGSPDPVTLRALADQVVAALAVKKPVKVLAAEKSAPRRRYVPDTHRAESEFGLCAWTPLEHALRQTALAMKLASIQKIG